MTGLPAADVRATPELVRALLSEQHPDLAKLSIECIASGWDNYTFRVGTRLAVRMPRRTHSAELVLREQTWLPRLAPLLSLPIPTPLRSGVPGCGYPWHWSVVPWFEGTCADRLQFDAVQARTFATFLRELHQRAPDDAPHNPSRGVALAVHASAVEARLGRLRRGPWIASILRDAWHAALATPPSAARLWLHADLHALNVLGLEGRIQAVIDWGDLTAGDPAADVASIWMVFDDRAARHSLLEGYAPTQELLARARGWAVALGTELLEAGLRNSARHAELGVATLRRLAADLQTPKISARYYGADVDPRGSEFAGREGMERASQTRSTAFFSAARIQQSKNSRAPLVLLPLLVTLLYWSIVRDLATDWWDDPNYSHGFLVPVLSAYYVWESRERLQRLAPRGSWLGLPVLLAALGMLVLGVIGAEQFLMRSSLVVVIAGLVLLHGGPAVSRELLFPIGFLFFMVPLPALVFNAVALPLQGVAAENATNVLDFLGVPVLRDGNVIHLSHITLGVTEACSGIRSLISLLAIAVFWTSLGVPGPWAKLVFVAAAIPITIVANSMRVVLTGLIAQEFGIRYAEGFFHSFSGWMIFVVAFVCLLAFQSLLARVRRRG